MTCENYTAEQFAMDLHRMCNMEPLCHQCAFVEDNCPFGENEMIPKIAVEKVYNWAQEHPERED